MDLDKYKKAWNNQPEETNTVSKVDIYKMAHSKSSSIVKWIFIIGLLEFLIPTFFSLFLDMEEANKLYDKIGLANFIIYISLFFYPIILYFIFLFYRNYKNISAIESTKDLMKNILKTRKTVRNYVLFNLSIATLIFVTIAITTINNEFSDLSTKQLIITSIIIAVIITILLILFWLFYQLLYGILLRKLNKNYKELTKLENLN